MPFFISKNGQTFGPHETEEIALFLETGVFLPGDYCWQEGWSEWRPISAALPDRPVPARDRTATDDRAGQNPPHHNGHIPSDIEIVGTLKLPGERTVTCKVDGEITCPSTVTIARGVSLKARIKAHSVVIFGTVEGDIHAEERAELKSSSTLHGDIHAARVLVEEGATFNGKSYVQSQNGAVPAGDAAR